LYFGYAAFSTGSSINSVQFDGFGSTTYAGRNIVGTTGFFSGNVGIGTASPSYPLHVNGTALSSSQNLKYIDYNSVPNWNTVAPGQTYLSIYGSGKIGTGDAFVIFSDSRIKIEEQTPASYLEIMSNVDVKNFSYIDKIQYGPQKKIGFFAQEVEEVVPGAVGQTTAVVPTIYREAEAFTDTTLTVTGHGLTTEKKLEIVDLENGKTKIDIVRVIDADNLEVKFEKVPKDKLFVVGPEVDDSRMVNHDYLMAVGFGGLKELHALVKTQAQTIESLEARLASLESRLAAAGI
jgi:hypothetical protein